MRLTVFGGTGPTGLLFVEQALTEGHEVVAFARTLSKLPHHPQLSVFLGTLDDGARIAQAIVGSDAVVSLLGPGTNAADVPPLIAGTRNIVAAMREHGVRRLVAVGTPSMSDDADRKDWKIDLLVKLIRRFQRRPTTRSSTSAASSGSRIWTGPLCGCRFSPTGRARVG